nr:hypothetical protein B0A51_11427 [Rachicladosporium sp. CCFEE 5018]
MASPVKSLNTAGEGHHRIIFQGKPDGSIPRLTHSTRKIMPRCIDEWLTTLGEEGVAGSDTYLDVRDQTLFEPILRVVQWVKHGAYVPFLPGTHIELQVKRAEGSVVGYEPPRHADDKSHWPATETHKYFLRELEVIELATKIECQELLDYAIRNISHRYPFYETQIIAVLRKMREMRTSAEEPLFRESYLADFLQRRIIEYKAQLSVNQDFLNMLRSIIPIKFQYDACVVVADAESFAAAASELKKGMTKEVEVEALTGHLMAHELFVLETANVRSPATDPRPQRRRMDETEALDHPVVSTPQSAIRAHPSPLRYDKPRAPADRLGPGQPTGAEYDLFLPNAQRPHVPTIPQSALDLAVANAIKDSRIIIFSRDGRGELRHDRHEERPADRHERDFRYRAGETLELMPQEEEIGVRQRNILVRNSRGETGAVSAREEYRVAQDVLRQEFTNQREDLDLKSPFRYSGSVKREKSEERGRDRRGNRSRSSSGTSRNETCTRGPWVPLDRGVKRTKRDYRAS